MRKRLLTAILGKPINFNRECCHGCPYMKRNYLSMSFSCALFEKALNYSDIEKTVYRCQDCRGKYAN